MLTNEGLQTVISPSAEISAAPSPEVVRQQRLMQTLKEEQQQKILHLHEETEVLLQQLRELKRQRQQVDDRQWVATPIG